MSDPRRSKRRTARLRREWVGGKRRRYRRKGRRKYDDRRCSDEAEAFERASCRGCAIVHDLPAWIGLMRAAVGHIFRHRHAHRLRRFRAHASTGAYRQHHYRQSDQKRYNGAADAHGCACVKIASCSRPRSSDDFASHMSAHGTSRHFAATHHFGRFRGKSDIHGGVASSASVVNDPTRTCDAGIFFALHALTAVHDFQRPSSFSGSIPAGCREHHEMPLTSLAGGRRNN
jgi:hypothetical protein